MKTATTGASPPTQQHSPLFHGKKECPLPQTNSTIANIPWLMGPLLTFWLLLSFLSAGATARGSVHKNKDSFSSHVLSRTGPIPLASGRRAPAPAQNGPSACRHPTQQQPAAASDDGTAMSSSLSSSTPPDSSFPQAAPPCRPTCRILLLLHRRWRRRRGPHHSRRWRSRPRLRCRRRRTGRRGRPRLRCRRGGLLRGGRRAHDCRCDTWRCGVSSPGNTHKAAWPENTCQHTALLITHAEMDCPRAKAHIQGPFPSPHHPCSSPGMGRGAAG